MAGVINDMSAMHAKVVSTFRIWYNSVWSTFSRGFQTRCGKKNIVLIIMFTVLKISFGTLNSAKDSLSARVGTVTIIILRK